EVISGVGLEIRFHTALMVTINAADLGGPARTDNEVTFACAMNFLAMSIQQSRFDTKKGQGCRAGFQIGQASERADHRCTGFGLPPGINNWQTAVANN